MTMHEREEKGLADLRARCPDRPCYIHPIYGVPVAGPTIEEREELAEILAEDEREQEARLRDPKVVLDFIRDCNGENHERHARYLALHKRVKSVEEVISVMSKTTFRESGSTVVARIRTKDNKRMLVRASSSHYSGSFYEPPSSEGDVVRIKESDLPKAP